MNQRLTGQLEIIKNNADHYADFIRLNEAWIEEHFQIEEADRQLADDPDAIVRHGGFIFTGVLDDVVVGTTALFKNPKNEYELARMAVGSEYRGRGFGRQLAEHALSVARDNNARRVFLYTNTILGPAISLYNSLGFTEIKECVDTAYCRCNTVMEKSLT